jgi:hypothetical protein
MSSGSWHQALIRAKTVAEIAFDFRNLQGRALFLHDGTLWAFAYLERATCLRPMKYFPSPADGSSRQATKSLMILIGRVFA